MRIASSIRNKLPPRKRGVQGLYGFITDPDFEGLKTMGYTSLADNPEINTAVNRVCELISSMTIHLMSNTNSGDERIKNALSKKMDITPNRWMTRKTFISNIVRTLLLEGDGNAVVYPITKNGLLESLEPIPASYVSYIEDPTGFGYSVRINGKGYHPDDLCHFVINPGRSHPWKGSGYRVALKDVAHNLKQAGETKKGFMESKWKPSVIIKADGFSDEFSTEEGRERLLNKYIKTSEAGQPWIIPADAFEVHDVKPLSLNDLAINDSVTLDKKTVASIVGIPAFLIGAGTFNEKEWDNFINTTIKDICIAIEQEFTRKLLINPNWYWRFNSRSLYSYDINTLSTVGANMYTRGIMTGNEVRDWLGLTPKTGLDELIILENYIPQGMIGDQKKLKGGGEENGDE